MASIVAGGQSCIRMIPPVVCRSPWVDTAYVVAAALHLTHFEYRYLNESRGDHVNGFA
jgi:hypothetical protein